MPQILTVTQDPDETSDQFAARIASEMADFFPDADESAEPADESAEPAEESTDETSTEPEEGD
jgi:hypothetical protein